MKRTHGYFWLVAVIFLALLSASASAAVSVRRYYTGSVGNTAIQMDLLLDGSKITGFYYYDRTGELLTLSGTLEKNNAASVTATLGGKPNGTFSGEFGQRFDTWSGTWTSADETRKLPFSLKAVAEYTTRKVQVSGVPGLVTYPQFLGTSRPIQDLNGRIRQDLALKEASFTKSVAQSLQSPYYKKHPELMQKWDMNYRADITYASPELVSLAVTTYTFTGGAHGMTHYTSENYRIVDGKAEPLQLTDLLIPGSAYPQLLSKTILDQLRKKGAEWVKNGEVTKIELKDLQSFTISPRGLTFYFDPYAMGPYAQGHFTATVPYTSLRPYMRLKGPLGRFIPRREPGLRRG